jgi:hypothetical protein
MSPIRLFILAAIFTLNFSGSPKPINSWFTTLPNKMTYNFRLEDDEIIPWIGNRRLAWQDFMGSPRKHTDAVASTSTSLGISYQIKHGELVYHISCNFSKVKSWGSLRTDYILAHEQGHFDITEIFARKLFQAMKEYEMNRKTFKKDINQIYENIVREKEELQAMYDSETDHSRKRKYQYEWFEKIDSLLQETLPYAQYP